MRDGSGTIKCPNGNILFRTTDGICCIMVRHAKMMTRGRNLLFSLKHGDKVIDMSLLFRHPSASLVKVLIFLNRVGVIVMEGGKS